MTYLEYSEKHKEITSKMTPISSRIHSILEDNNFQNDDKLRNNETFNLLRKEYDILASDLRALNKAYILNS